jgi:LacI family transcriptional regulator
MTRSRSLTGGLESTTDLRERGSVGTVTLRDIARVSGVSAQTVSCVINNTGSVSEAVRERVRLIAGQMGYRPNKSAKAMRTGRSQILGLVISDMGNPFFPELAQSVEHAAADAGYAVFLVDGHGSLESVADRIAALSSHLVDGVITTEYSPAIDRLGLPTVLIGGPVSGIDCVNADDTAGGAMLATHMLTKGHRDFGFITGSLGKCLAVRRQSFVETMAAAGGKIVWELMVSEDESITDELRTALRRRDITALICSNDLIAVRALHVLRQLGRNVPEDLSVTGFDDISWAAIVTPPLTTVRQPFMAMGVQAVTLLQKRIADRKRRYRHLKLRVKLVERESVAGIAGSLQNPVTAEDPLLPVPAGMHV